MPHWVWYAFALAFWILLALVACLIVWALIRWLAREYRLARRVRSGGR